jgi:transglutaminase-like putative cysteine protease
MMSNLVALHHVTRYQYDRPVSLGPHVVRLCPAPYARARVTGYSLKVTSPPHVVSWQYDANGNKVARFVFQEQASELCIAVDLVADLQGINPFDFLVEPGAQTFPFGYAKELRSELAPCLVTEPAGPRMAVLLTSISRERRGSVDFLVDLNQRLQRQIHYVTRAEQGVQMVEETLTASCGSCRDTAWLLVQVLRNLGLAARFVSGYLIQLKPDVAPPDGSSAPAEDSASLHAWTEVYIPGAGWIGFDPTSGLLCGEGHLPLAASPHFSSAAAVSGSVSPAEASFSFQMQLTRVGAAASEVTFRRAP